MSSPEYLQRLQHAIECATSFLDGKATALQTGREITSSALVELPCWEALGGATGPLSALYSAADEADHQYFVGADVERWHSEVREQKRSALEAAEAKWRAQVERACHALLTYRTAGNVRFGSKADFKRSGSRPRGTIPRVGHWARMSRSSSWASLGFDSWFLAMEAAHVIGLRLLRLSACDESSVAEARRMAGEKLSAAWGLQSIALNGGLGLTPPTAIRRSLDFYGSKVRSNRRRLSTPTRPA